MKALSLALALLASLPVASCALSQKDASAREWQRSECNKVIDKDDRERCLKRANSEY
ncbi:MAG: hypothetical protein ACXWAC_01435 [Usitatibacter sp.]